MRHFSVGCGAGFDAEIMTGTTGAAKRRFGMAAYVAKTLEVLGKLEVVRHRITIDGHTREVDATSVLVVNCATSYAQLAESFGRTIVVDRSIENLPRAEIDDARLSIALGNLVENAIKYSYRGTEILVRSYLELEPILRRDALIEVVIQVCDTGREVAAAEQQRIFERGTRGTAATAAVRSSTPAGR